MAITSKESTDALITHSWQREVKNLVPAAAVIPAPIAYIKVVSVKARSWICARDGLTTTFTGAHYRSKVITVEYFRAVQGYLWVKTAFIRSQPIFDFYNFRSLLHVIVSITAQKKPADPQQCYRFQGFSHGSSKCRRPRKCSRCWENHHKKDLLVPSLQGGQGGQHAAKLSRKSRPDKPAAMQPTAKPPSPGYAQGKAQADARVANFTRNSTTTSGDEGQLMRKLKQPPPSSAAY
ncbi:hypothetical protein J6590_042538 [Homalodisca vitripennis]|nr:hypothetical protein J6590_042538 [Homalodisca vitripennis]